MSRIAILLCCVCVLSACGGCVGYFLGLSDKEVRRVRQVVAELEAKNAELVEQNLALQKELESLRKDDPGKTRERPPGASVSTPEGVAEGATEGVAETSCRD